MDKQVFIDRILETENLTDELADDQANWLLNWGTSHLDEVLHGVDDEETAGTRVNALMAVMRKINRISAVYSHKTPAELAESLADLDHLFQEAFEPDTSQPADASSEQYQAAAQKLAGLEIGPAVEFLANRQFRTDVGPESGPKEPGGGSGGGGTPVAAVPQPEPRPEPEPERSGFRSWITRLFARFRKNSVHH